MLLHAIDEWHVMVGRAAIEQLIPFVAESLGSVSA
jgi:hypothetical protein